MSDDFEKELNEKLRSGITPKSNIVQFPSQTIKGNNNTQIGNQQQKNQSIEGNNNTQVAGDYIVAPKTVKQELPLPPNCIGANVALMKRINNLFKAVKKEQEKYHGSSYNFKAIYGQLAHQFHLPPKDWRQIFTLDEMFADQVINFLQDTLNNTIGGRIQKAAKKSGYKHNQGHCFRLETQYIEHLGWSEAERKQQLMLVMGCSSRKELSLVQFNEWVVYLTRLCDAKYEE